MENNKAQNVSKKATKQDYEDLDSRLQKSRFGSRTTGLDRANKSANKLTTVEREKQLINSPYLYLSETEKADIVKKKLREQDQKEAKKKAEAAKKANKGRSGFSMIKTDVTEIFRRKNRAEDRRREKVRKRTAAKYLKLILTGEQNEPELCPRMFAILLIWLIVVVSILGIVYFQTSWLLPFKILIGSASEELGCFAEVKLIPLANGIGRTTTGGSSGVIQTQNIAAISVLATSAQVSDSSTVGQKIGST